MVLAVLHQVFCRMRYVMYAGMASIALLSVMLLLPNSTLIFQILASDTSSIFVKLNFILSLYGTLSSNYTLFSGSVLLVLVILFGINVALLIYSPPIPRPVRAGMKGVPVSVSPSL